MGFVFIFWSFVCWLGFVWFWFCFYEPHAFLVLQGLRQDGDFPSLPILAFMFSRPVYCPTAYEQQCLPKFLLGYNLPSDRSPAPEPTCLVEGSQCFRED